LLVSINALNTTNKLRSTAFQLISFIVSSNLIDLNNWIVTRNLYPIKMECPNLDDTSKVE
ncbi:hypothetical protein L4C31_14790, partial [Aliivibrio sifiae]